MPLRAKFSTSAMAAMAAAENEVKFSSNKAVRQILLNRPKKLNSLNHAMVKEIRPRLSEWAKSDVASLVVLKGEGEKALCAGGDVTTLATGIKENGEAGSQQAAEYFQDEYSMNYEIATFPKPYIAIMDGITMGGGVGLSVHAPFRIATEKTLFAMPETTIGFFPDVGGTFFLPRLDGELGTYLALTSARLTGYDVFYAGIATHFVPSSRLPALEERLSELHNSNGLTPVEYFDSVSATIDEFSGTAPENYKFPYDRDFIDTVFAKDSVDEILAALSQSESEASQKTKELLLSRSPTSVRVTLAALRRGKTMDIASVLKEEAILAENFMYNPDFVEGVSALLLTKPARDPKWLPSWEESKQADTQSYFQIRENSIGELNLDSEKSYQKHPYHYALPTEEDIKDYVIGNTSGRDYKTTADETIKHFVEKTNGKLGVEAKVADVLSRKTKPDSSDATLLDWIY